jgi:hypothetical protein
MHHEERSKKQKQKSKTKQAGKTKCTKENAKELSCQQFKTVLW